MSGDPGRVKVTIWSDYVCPFCYLEVPALRRLEGELGDRVDLDWRAFELRPEPVPTLDPDSGYLDDVWASAVRPMAEERGVEIRRPDVQPRSRQALETARMARDRGVFDPVHEALFEAFFREGRDLGDVEVLLDVAGSAGLDPGELETALGENRYTESVLDDQVEARELGVTGVPAIFVAPAGVPLEEATTLEGAQPYEVLVEAVRDVLDGEAHPGGEEGGTHEVPAPPADSDGGGREEGRPGAGSDGRDGDDAGGSGTGR